MVDDLDKKINKYEERIRREYQEAKKQGKAKKFIAREEDVQIIFPDERKK
jgi:hypothetical protein